MGSLSLLPHDIWHTICQYLDEEDIRSLRLINKNVCSKISVRQLLAAKICKIYRSACKWAKNFNEYSDKPFEHYVTTFQNISSDCFSFNLEKLQQKLNEMKSSLVYGQVYLNSHNILDRIPYLKQFTNHHRYSMQHYCLQHLGKSLSPKEGLFIDLIFHSNGKQNDLWKAWDNHEEKEVIKHPELGFKLPISYPLEFFKDVKEGECIAFPLEKKLLIITCKQKGIVGVTGNNKSFEDILIAASTREPSKLLDASLEQIYFAPKDNLVKDEKKHDE
ncbi:MAG: hypothetical protein K0S74_1321 [Chlamydiales bacterium]|jgi:hypothetical protein|nr:hypothetical protein [Chlamydiales bacterium]